MASPDFEVSQYDLGVTSVRMVRAGNVVQVVFSTKHAARVFYAEVATRFKRDEGKWKSE